MSGVRVDKFLWSIRVFKTRSISVDACKRNNVLVNDTVAKSSRCVKVGDVIEVRKDGGNMIRVYRVVNLLEKRVGAKLVDNYVEDCTPAEVYVDEAIRNKRIRDDRIARKGQGIRKQGMGRPTKKERRQIEDL